MAEISVGDLVARLRLDSADFSRGIATAVEALRQFQQTMSQQSGGANATMAQSLRQITTALGTMQQGQQQATQTSQQLTQAMGQLSQAIQQGRQQAQQFSATWQQVFAVAAGVGLATSLQALVRDMRNLLTESLQLAAKMQDLNLAFRAIEGSAGASNRTLTFLFDTSQKLGVDFEKVADGFKRLDQAAKGTALEGEGVRQVFENVIAGARVLGVSSQQTSQAIVALEQILTKGKLTAEEYRRQLGNAIPGALGLMAQGLGTTTRELEEMIRLGLIPAESGVIALGNAMGQLRATSGVETVEQLSSTFNRLKNETTAWMTAIGEGLASTIQPFLTDLLKLSQTLRDLFNIKPPGVQSAPGANQRSIFSMLFPGIFTPETLGMPAPGTTGPNEQPGPTPQPQLGFASSAYDALLRQQAARVQFDPDVFSRMIKEESGFDPNARSRVNRNGERALGLGQILPSTGADYGLTNFSDFFDPEKNLTTSANVLRDYRKTIQDRFGALADETRIVLAAYNAGIGNVVKAIEETQRIGEQVTYGQVLGRLPKPEETGPYVQKIMGTYTRPGAGTQETAYGTLPAPALPTPPATAGQQDPLEPMLKNANEVLTSLDSIQKRMDAIANNPDLNQGGLLNKALVQQADEAVKKYQVLGTTLASFPQLFDRMQPAQREVVALAAQQVLLIQRRLAEEAETPAESRRRIQELREAERAQEQLDQQAQREDRTRRHQDIQDLDIFGLLLSPEQEQQLKQAATEQHQRIQQFAKSLDIFGLELSPEQEKQRRDETAYLQRLRNTYEQLQAPRDERLDVRLRQEGTTKVTSEQGREEEERLLAQIRAQENLNKAAQLFEQFGNSVASAWTTALTSIADGTKSVSEAFRDMARSILQSLAQIAAQEGFKALISLGVRAIAGAAAGGITTGVTTGGRLIYEAPFR